MQLIRLFEPQTQTIEPVSALTRADRFERTFEEIDPCDISFAKLYSGNITLTTIQGYGFEVMKAAPERKLITHKGVTETPSPSLRACFENVCAEIEATGGRIHRVQCITTLHNNRHMQTESCINTKHILFASHSDIKDHMALYLGGYGGRLTLYQDIDKITADMDHQSLPDGDLLNYTHGKHRSNLIDARTWIAFKQIGSVEITPDLGEGVHFKMDFKKLPEQEQYLPPLSIIIAPDPLRDEVGDIIHFHDNREHYDRQREERALQLRDRLVTLNPAITVL